MTTLLNLFYQLPPEFIVLCFFLASLAYLRALQRFARCRWFRCGIWGTLIIWTAATIWITTLSRSPGPVHMPELIPFHSYREMVATGVKEIARANFMNVALFYPAGLLAASLLPESWPRCRKVLSTGILLAVLSLLIEYGQFSYALGEPEIDDLIHNTVGAMLGTIPIVLRDILHHPN